MTASVNSSPARSIGGSAFLYHDLPVEVEGIVDHTVVSGWLKFRDQKKWKLRWGVVTKLSPAADCVHLQLYQDCKDRYKQGLTKASLSLNHFLGVETGFTLDNESNTIAIVCRDVVVILAFDTREILIQWQMKINNNLGQGQQFSVQIVSSPVKTKINSGPAKLHIQNHKLCLTAGIPPMLAGYWELKHLRRFGVVDGKFCFEGGSRCGRWEGIYVLNTHEADEIKWHMQLATEGRIQSKRHLISRNKSESPVKRNFQRISADCKHTIEDCSDILVGVGGAYPYCMNRSFEDIVRWPKQEVCHASPWSSLFNPEYPSDAPEFQDCKPLRRQNSEQSRGTLHSKSSTLEENMMQDPKFSVHRSNSFRHVCNNKESIAQVHRPSKLLTQFEGENSELFNTNTIAVDRTKPPERPPKPLKYTMTTEREVSECTCRYPPHQPHDQYDNYDIPAAISLSATKKNQLHNEFQFENPDSVLDMKYYKSTVHYNYDVPPPPVPVPNVCDYREKMSILVESRECCADKYQTTCVCNQLKTCWPYTWLHLAYCKRNNGIHQSIIPVEKKKSIDGCSNALSALYATVDLSKKKLKEYPPPPAIPKRSDVQNYRKRPNFMNNYANDNFIVSLATYENSGQSRNSFRPKSPNSNNCKIPEKSQPERNRSNDYVAMNAQVHFSARHYLQNHLVATGNSDDGQIKTRLDQPYRCNLQQRLNSPKFRKWNSLTTLTHWNDVDCLTDRLKSKSIEYVDVKPCSDIKKSTSDHHYENTQNANHRDSSSSNDSGFSFGSVKVVKNKTTDDGKEFPINQYNRLLFPKRSKSSEPFQERIEWNNSSCSKWCLDDVRVNQFYSRSTEDNASINPKSADKSSIPYMDGQSTSSETSDISDYIETLSLSSYSSSETHQNNRLQFHNTAKLKPRSRNQYEKVHKILTQDFSGNR